MSAREIEDSEKFISESEVSRVHDLNVLVLFITKFYSYVFDRLKQKHPGCRLNNWVDSFILSADLEAKGDNSLKNAIAEIMETEAGITINDWSELQAIRRLRNAISHPSSTASAASSALEQRWKKHRSYTALKKMLNVAEKIQTTAQTPPRTPIQHIPAANWRSTMRNRDAMHENASE